MVFYSEFSSFVGRKETCHRKKMASGRLDKIKGVGFTYVQLYAFDHVDAKEKLKLVL